MDKIFKALSIANAGMGIGVNFQKFQEIREQRALAPIKEAREAKQAAATLKGTQADTAQTVSATEQAQLTGEAARELTTAQAGRQRALTTQIERETAGLPTAREAAQARADKVTQARNERITKFQQNWQATPAFKEITGAHRAAGNMLKLTETGPNGEPPDNLKVQMALRQAIKASGDSRPSDADIRAMMPDPSLRARVNREYELALAGKPPAGDVEALQALGRIMEANAEQQLQRNALAFSKTQGRQFGDNAQEIADEFLVPSAFTDTGAEDEPAPPPGAVPGQEQAAGPGGVPLAPPPPEFSEAEIKKVMDGANVNRGEAIFRLKKAAGAQ